MDGGSPQTIVPRQGPAFAWQDVPRWWFDNDPFKTRFFDAMSLLFPEGEKFFIACVRDYRDDITDPQLRAQVKDFMYQEGTPGMVLTARTRVGEGKSVSVRVELGGVWTLKK